MPNGFSRQKGARGERDLVNKIGGSAQRRGYAGVKTPVDIETDFAQYQVRNKTIGGSEIARELGILSAVTSKNTYVAFKVKGKWFIAESLKQHIDDHGETLKVEEE